MLLESGPRYDCNKATAIPQPATIPLVLLPASAAAPATLMNLGASYWRSHPCQAWRESFRLRCSVEGRDWDSLVTVVAVEEYCSHAVAFCQAASPSTPRENAASKAPAPGFPPQASSWP
eukprot:8012363-Heterocapsa_arctica.AAC.1